MEEKKLNPFELFALFLIFTVMCWTASSMAWLKKIDTALGAPIYRSWQWFDHFLDSSLFARFQVTLAVAALLLALFSALVFGNETLTNWFWENAFSQSWWPMPEMPK